MKGSLIVVSAPSGAGKTSLTHAAIDQLASDGHDVSFSVSYTTRASRPGELDGRDYHFVSEETFVDMADRGAFLEHARVFDRRYGTGRERTLAVLEQGLDVVLDIDWQGARQVRTAYPDAVLVYVLPPSTEALRARLSGRGQDSDDVIERRMRDAAAEMSHWREYDYVIVNDDFDAAARSLVAVFRAARLRRVLVEAGPVGELARSLVKPG
ncbi:guanylate kinase [uncultured Abyssibacter sp.]|uniref:guanylate kinase n=1 Tax=uncultured Abyssibacter sp. TaxID=2320202 RepID=UPI0032B1C8A7